MFCHAQAFFFFGHIPRQGHVPASVNHRVPLSSAIDLASDLEKYHHVRNVCVFKAGITHCADAIPLICSRQTIKLPVPEIRYDLVRILRVAIRLLPVAVDDFVCL